MPATAATRTAATAPVHPLGLELWPPRPAAASLLPLCCSVGQRSSPPRPPVASLLSRPALESLPTPCDHRLVRAILLIRVLRQAALAARPNSGGVPAGRRAAQRPPPRCHRRLLRHPVCGGAHRGPAVGAASAARLGQGFARKGLEPHAATGHRPQATGHRPQAEIRPPRPARCTLRLIPPPSVPPSLCAWTDALLEATSFSARWYPPQQGSNPRLILSVRPSANPAFGPLCGQPAAHLRAVVPRLRPRRG